jgi:antitoxin (DNA-binding transcriptional repressor) of toxin-antitoxin stability system
MNKNPLIQKKTTTELLLASNAASYAKRVTKSVDLKDAGGKFSELADSVLSGEEVLFSKEGKTVMKLVPFLEPETKPTDSEKVGLNLGCGIPFAPDFTWDQWEESEREMEKIWRKHGYID